MLARARVARALEGGAWSSPVSRALARAYAPFASRAVVRPLRVRLPAGVRLVTVGGATLGGSGRTRVALACARATGAVLVGHAYRAEPRAARLVSPDDAPAEVGDEALACARAGVRVVVGPTRDAALALAATLDDLLVVDGALQTSPRAALAILAVDAAAPWGAGELPPAGDLRAPIEALLAAADVVVETRADVPDAIVAELLALRARGEPFALFTALARPGRIVAALARRGLRPAAHVAIADHGPMTRAAARAIAELDRRRAPTWLATPKCATHLIPVAAPAALAPHAPKIVVVPDAVSLHDDVRARLADLRLPRRLDPPRASDLV